MVGDFKAMLHICGMRLRKLVLYCYDSFTPYHHAKSTTNK